MSKVESDDGHKIEIDILSNKPGDSITPSDIDNDEILLKADKHLQSSLHFYNKRDYQPAEKIDFAKISSQYVSN